MKEVLAFGLLMALFISPDEKIMPVSYNSLIQKSEILYHEKEYLESAKTYERAFKIFPLDVRENDRYNAACSWALSNKVNNSFIQLNVIAKHNFDNYDNLVSDNDLILLHSDQRWLPLLKLININKRNAKRKLDIQLVKELDTIYDADQRYRSQIADNGYNSKQIESLKKTIRKNDSINLKKARGILDRIGWPGMDVIGKQGSKALFLVIQHADLNTEERYLPMLKEAVKRKKASPDNLALLEDRIAIYKGKSQIYGSQIGRNDKTKEFYLLPVIDPINLDKRRSDIGLEPIANYLIDFNISWDLKKYLKDLPLLIEMNKEVKRQTY